MRLTSSLCAFLGAHPFVVRWDWFTDDVEEEVATGVAEEFELFFQVFDDIVEVTVRAQVIDEAAVFGIEFDDTLGVVSDRGELAPVSDDAFVLGEFVKFLFRQGRYSADLETVERFVGVGPFGVDDAPGHTALEDRFRHDFEVVIQRLDRYLGRGAFFVGHFRDLSELWLE